MDARDLSADVEDAVKQVLGYLNFSSGATDPAFFKGLNSVFSAVSASESVKPGTSRSKSRPATWRLVTEFLSTQLNELASDSSTFANSDQARHALDNVPHIVGAYRRFHTDLLQHQSDEFLFNAYMYGRICEAILSSDSDNEQLTDSVIAKLNDFIGHRPVPTLQARQHEPYPHEWVRPVPLYIQSVELVAGCYSEVTAKAIEILRQTDSQILRAAWFDPEELEELAVDPRAYDFEHPANKRPNYHFGQWDPHYIDNRGYYRRFVLRQVTLDALLSRLPESTDSDTYHELLFEAGAVLAGTILMASGISGYGPETHDSDTTLVSLVPRIATYRDAFYERLLEQVSGDHAARLAEEADRLHQPFGAARQHLNRYLAQKRARQLARVKLARVFARMGYLDAAERQSKQVAVTSSRLLCRMDSCLTSGHQALDRQDLEQTGKELTTIRDLLHRGIQCGAIVDPWNILGFDANFSLFPALENSVHDHRIDDLLVIVHRVCKLYARFWSEAAAANAVDTMAPLIAQFREFADWWHQFAAHEVSSVDAISSQEACDAASRVAAALAQWNQQGAEAGDVAFWAPHVENFDSPSAYGLVVETLMQKCDLVSTMSLLIYWLSQAPRIRLDSAECSFFSLTQRWLGLLIEDLLSHNKSRDTKSQKDWTLIGKFVDYLEANANDYWEVPDFAFANGGTPTAENRHDEMQEDDEDEEDLYRAAYENVVYTDSTDDGIDGSLFDTGSTTNDEIVVESERIVDRLSFLENLAHLWLRGSLTYAAGHRQGEPIDIRATMDTLGRWRSRAAQLIDGLSELAHAVENHRLPAPRSDYDSLLEFDRQRFFRESLLENIMIASVALLEADQLMAATQMVIGDQDAATAIAELDFDTESDDVQLRRHAAVVLGCLLTESLDEASEHVRQLCEVMAEQEILYVPLSKGGHVRSIIKARSRQRLIENLIIWLPRQGLLDDTFQVLESARLMERNSPVGPGAITQFDELFEAATRQIIESLVLATEDVEALTSQELVHYVERYTERLLAIWLEHSKTLRLSTLEKVRKDKRWDSLVEFIRQYGGDLFTQQFLALGNIRAILHAGVDQWLEQAEQSGEHSDVRLLQCLGESISKREAVQHLSLILETIAENYDEYRDYNSTTTQSDRGEMLYTLVDFLRLRSAYDRVTWNLRPVLFAHEILVRRGKNEAAQIWRRGLAERIGEEAEMYMRRLSELQTKYAMSLSSITDRLSERFLRPMTVDRMRALVEPALRHPDAVEGRHAFELLEDESNLLMREPAGSGLDVPNWLVALDDEVEQIRRVQKLGVIDDVHWLIPVRKLHPEELDTLEDDE